MPTPAARQFAVAMLALTSVLALAACTSAQPQTQPSPAGSGSAGSTGSAGTATSSVAPTRGPTPEPKPACLGAVAVTVNVSKNWKTWPTPCIAVGGVLRIANLGPDGLAQNTPDKTSCNYAAGVHSCRLIGTGTAKLTVTNPDGAHPLAATVIASSKLPATACESTSPYVLDGSDGGPPWWALCLKQNVVLRIENHGPEGVVVDPAASVNCRYAAGVRECKFLKTGTVRFTITTETEVRPLIVVVIK